MFENVIAADIGSSVTRLATKNGICCSASRVALDPENNLRILAVGDKSKKMVNVTTVYPIREGAVADTELAAIMIRRLALDMLRRRSLYGVTLRIALPMAISDIRKAAAVEMAREAGFSSVKIYDSMLLGALGAGVNIDSAKANMVVDIGRERITTLLCANGGIIHETVSCFGSYCIDKLIQSHIANEHGIIIGAKTAERIKQELDNPLFAINGRQAENGLPINVDIKAGAVREAIQPGVEAIGNEIIKAISNVPPETSEDLLENGITLIGGGSAQFGLATQLRVQLGIPVKLAENPEHAVIFGMQSHLWKIRMGKKVKGKLNGEIAL